MKRRSPVGQRVRDFVAGRAWGRTSSTGYFAHRTPRGTGRRRLRAEPLEERCLLSVTTFADDTLVWDTANGGDVDNDGTISPGDVVIFAPGEAGETDNLVYGLDAFDSIQQAIDEVEPGGSVLVATGEYVGMLLVDKDVTLTGATGVASDVVLSNDQEGNFLMTIDDGDVTIQDLRIAGGPSFPGIVCFGWDSAVTLSSIEVFGGSGIEFHGESLVVTDCLFQDALGIGVDMYAGTATIDQNQFINCDLPIELWGLDGDVSARITNNTFLASEDIGLNAITVDTATALIEGNYFDQFLSAAVRLNWDAVVDLGQLEDGVDFTGLGISSGGNDFSSITPDNPSAPAIENGVYDGVVPGPQGLPPTGSDTPAFGNIWFSDDPLEIEQVIWHDPDTYNMMAFVDYAVLGDLSLETVQNEVGGETVATLSGSFANDPQAHSVLIDWGDGGTDTVALDQGVWTFDVDHTYAGGGGGGGAPVVDDATMAVEENSLNGTLVGTVVASGGGGGGGSYTINVTVSDSQGGELDGSTTVEVDGGGGPLTYSVIGGTGQAAFAIDPVTGEITVADQTLLDFEAITSYTLEVQVSDGIATDTAVVTVELINRPSVTGTVIVDVNENGEYDANEPTIDNVTIQLLDATGAPVLDDLGNPVTATTEAGFYLFEDLVAGTYRLHEVQPTGVDDGAELLGSLGGSIPANDTMEVTLAATDASDYVFAEIGQNVSDGDTATSGFWLSRQGRNLLTQAGPALAEWLTDNFGNVFGDELVGASGLDVYRFYQTELLRHRSILSLLTTKVDVDFTALALSMYFTNSNLAGNLGASYGFNVTDTGIATKVVSVRSYGAAFGVANNTEMTIMQLLQATNAMTDSEDNLTGYANTYDVNGDGRVSVSEAVLRVLADSLFDRIIRSGD